MVAIAKRVFVHLLEDAIVEKIGNNMGKAIPEKLALMGIKCSSSLVYTKSGFVCLEVVLHQLSIPLLVSTASGSPAKGEFVRKILSFISFPRFDAFLNRVLLQFICSRILSTLPARVQTKLQDKLNAEVLVIACSEEEQGPVLVSTIQDLNQPVNSNAQVEVSDS